MIFMIDSMPSINKLDISIQLASRFQNSIVQVNTYNEDIPTINDIYEKILFFDRANACMTTQLMILSILSNSISKTIQSMNTVQMIFCDYSLFWPMVWFNVFVQEKLLSREESRALSKVLEGIIARFMKAVAERHYHIFYIYVDYPMSHMRSFLEPEDGIRSAVISPYRLCIYRKVHNEVRSHNPKGDYFMWIRENIIKFHQRYSMRRIDNYNLSMKQALIDEIIRIIETEKLAIPLPNFPPQESREPSNIEKPWYPTEMMEYNVDDLFNL